MTDQNVLPMVPVSTSADTQSPIGPLGLACLTLLLLSIGGNGYLWHQWQQNQAVEQAMTQSIAELQALNVQIQDLQRLKITVDQWATHLDSLKKAIADCRSQNEAINVEIKRLQDSRMAYEAFVQKQLQVYQEKSAKPVKPVESPKRNEVNW